MTLPVAPAPSSSPATSSHEVVIHCDGACKGNPGPGGFGAWLQAGPFHREVLGGEANTTNNRMELRAAIESLRLLKKPVPVRVVTDSQYVIKGVTEWRKGWLRRGWKDSKNKPVKNRELWEALFALVDQHQITWEWVKGHNGHNGNERADQLANEGLLHAQRTGNTGPLLRDPTKDCPTRRPDADDESTSTHA